MPGNMLDIYIWSHTQSKPLKRKLSFMGKESSSVLAALKREENIGHMSVTVTVFDQEDISKLNRSNMSTLPMEQVFTYERKSLGEIDPSKKKREQDVLMEEDEDIEFTRDLPLTQYSRGAPIEGKSLTLSVWPNKDLSGLGMYFGLSTPGSYSTTNVDMISESIRVDGEGNKIRHWEDGLSNREREMGRLINENNDYQIIIKHTIVPFIKEISSLQNKTLLEKLNDIEDSLKYLTKGMQDNNIPSSPEMETLIEQFKKIKTEHANLAFNFLGLSSNPAQSKMKYKRFLSDFNIDKRINTLIQNFNNQIAKECAQLQEIMKKNEKEIDLLKFQIKNMENTEGEHPMIISLPTKANGEHFYVDEMKVLEFMADQINARTPYNIYKKNCSDFVKEAVIAGISTEMKDAIKKLPNSRNFFEIKGIQTPEAVQKWVDTLKEHIVTINDDYKKENPSFSF